jgi:Ser/Thr protein kinase RdoA (MazF antagonist)
MSDALDYQSVLRFYPADCQPTAVEFLDTAGGLSGTRLWRLTTPRGLLLLRRWPPEHPPRERLEFIQAVLWHAHQEGFDRVPLPLENVAHQGYVSHAGHFWEIAPWLPGASDYHAAPSLTRLRNALTALAKYHQAVSSFPLAESSLCPSPSIGERLEQLRRLLSGELEQLRSLVTTAHDDYQPAAARIVELFPRVAPRVLSELERASAVEVSVVPCLRDVWHENVLFEGDEVSGLIDFGSLRAENVSADVARLLGSMAEDDRSQWRAGFAAYEQVRSLSEVEAMLAGTFDISGVLLGGTNWLTWIYDRRRVFDQPAAVQARLDYFVRRLTHLVESR